MAVPNRVLLVSREPATVADVRAAIGSNGNFELANVCGALPDLVSRLDGSCTPAALVDIDPEPMRIIEDMAPIVARFADTRFVILSSKLENELMLEAMQIGARHFLAKHTVVDELLDVLRRLAVNGSAVGGAAVTVLSASGGCGATTLAFNLANELGLEGRGPALLVDMDSCYGAAGPYLGLNGEYGVADVLDYDGHIDGHLIRSSAVEYSEALHALLSPITISFSQPKPMRFESLRDVLRACKHTYPYTVIDAPHMPMDVAAILAKESDVTLIVFQLTVKDIHLVRSIRSSLVNCGIAPDGVVPVANRYAKRGPISLKQAEQPLGGMRIELVRNDFRNAVRGLNYGEPLAQSAPSSGLRRDICQLAVHIGLKKETL